MTNEPKATHTPGPWKASRRHPALNKIVYVDAGDQEVCVLYCTPHDCTNGNLIAAAPDLLALAKRYASECAWCSGTGTIEHVPFDNGVSSTSKCIQCADIRAVIEKAEGGA